MHTFLACRAGVFGTDDGDHAELRRDDVEALGDILADPNHRTTAARAG
jgi:putative ubiquitin-RnfH superfamily antitoxin RatB of RatAB toxin-antitoxin module